MGRSRFDLPSSFRSKNEYIAPDNITDDGKHSPRAVHEDAVDVDFSVRRETMVWREDAGEKLKVPLLPTVLADRKLKMNIPMEG